MERLPTARNVIRSAAPFAIAGAFVSRTRAYRDHADGKSRGPTIVYRFNVYRLGHSGQVPACPDAFAIGNVDIVPLSSSDESVRASVAVGTVSGCIPGTGQGFRVPHRAPVKLPTPPRCADGSSRAPGHHDGRPLGNPSLFNH